ncbi:hypothetical protein A3B61_04055 [Candidatus Peribacteria bacterium RIFCSPLOWO2_01_FULL_53_10]|nr:MAG: hypothetical protein A3B61_04055 [Candidatus Peribacteria bacterium RIFCSPLOWO2_01_FULL_53_10]
MTESHTPTPAISDQPSRPTPGHIFHRMSLPVLLFCSVLAMTLGVSRIAILPALTSVEVGGIVRDAASLQKHADKLEAKLAVLEEDREAEILPMDGKEYRALVDAKMESLSTAELVDSFRTIARNIVPQTPNAIVITAVRQEISTQSLKLTGDVRGVGPGSMTVLAAFTEVLRDDPRVASLVAPSFARLEDPKIGVHSPFTITLTLR